ncbi:hypothetical protein H634G_04495 [Metarhizium anisopliae BRIP 53293]|uniref:Uncharacterized protein n=1 Tax=Metarhizium anisopliae BRIP 53293 TaxID=1291518 RepID=A0A0D9P2E1_METAN|nr:hypothetical protein H634G_04495 [Metarhizium anisopliae BRIP 53293]KJK86653.1 hypothetical protein H633G_09493 [Metarhizium anisopliae BRIP 53284]
MEPKTTDDNNLEQYCQSNGVFQSQAPGTASSRLSPRQMSQNTRTYILSPRIVAIPQQTELDGSEISVWVAVEISGKLSQISPSKILAPNETQNDKVAGIYVNHKLDRFFDFGCLYDLTVEVSAVPGTAILEVVHEQSWPTTIYAGTSVLIVVHVQLHCATRRPEMGHTRSRSNELMEELERQLGNVQTQLMNIRVSYHHSAFPEITNAKSPQSGLCHLQSRMETTATIAITQKSGGSLWSPRGKTPQNSLFPLMVQHWGDEKAISTQRRITDSQVTRVKDVGRDVASVTTPKVTESACMTFDFDMDSLYRSPGLQRYLLDGTSMNWPRANCLSKSRRPQSADKLQEAGRSSRSPVRDMYYFGERAIRALAPTPTSEKNVVRMHPAVSQGSDMGLKHKDSKFWDWGSWF